MSTLLFTPSSYAQEEAAAEKTLIVVLNLEAGGGVEPSDAELVAGLVAQSLGKGGHLEVVSADDMRRLADLEAQKQALGCDQSSCLAEIAGALGARYVVFGRMGKLGDVLLVQLNLFDAEQARAIAREDLRVASLGEIPAALDPAVRRLAGPLLPADAQAEPVAPTSAELPPESGFVSTAFLVSGATIAALGVVAAGIGGAGAVYAASVVSDREQAAADRNGAKGLGAAMTMTGAVGGAAAVVGAALLGLSFVAWE